jgi:predicted amidohydrolase
MDRIRACAASNAITVALSYSENFHNSAYIAQSLIGADGSALLHRRKIRPTHMERTVFGDGTEDSLHNLVNTKYGRVGMLACWEHTQPLLKYHTYLQRELVHVAAWPPLFEHSEQSQSFWSMSSQGRMMSTGR